MSPLICRSCGSALDRVFVDLGVSPLANSFVLPGDRLKPEAFYPLCAYVCETCFLVQLPALQTAADIFSDYIYFSSYSDTMLAHSEKYVTEVIPRLGLSSTSTVVEVASNDGYLLQYFQREGIPPLGIEPAHNVARVAIERGIPTREVFFGEESAKQLRAEGVAADLLLGNNVLAHVPDLHDFIRGVKHLLKPAGSATFEFPHLLRMLEDLLFDTIYHEHFSYFSLIAVKRAFEAHGLVVYDVELVATHGGSLRLWVRHAEHEALPVRKAVPEMCALERSRGLDRLETYALYAKQAAASKRRFLSFLFDCAERNDQVVGYGAPAKANTLLNYCGIRTDLLAYVVDRNPHKQNTLLPGTRIPVYSPERLRETRPAYVVILPWNLRDEIITQMAHIRDWGGRFVVPIPVPQVVP